MIELKNGDCLELMKDIPDKSVDMILCDLPYGTTDCKWDTIIPFNKHIKEINNRGKEIILYRDEYILQEVKKGKSYKDTINYFDNNAIDGLWEQYNRIIKDNGAIVLTATNPFSSMLVNSNIKGFKHEWIWDKKRPSGFQAAKYKPMQRHETVLVFTRNGERVNYYPIMEKRDKPIRGRVSSFSESSPLKYNDGKIRTYTHKNPQSILEFPKPTKVLHPTQKPVALFEYLIKTYTNENDTVLDNCMGSGTTGLACINTNRNFIGIELDEDYFKSATARLEAAKSQISIEDYFKSATARLEAAKSQELIKKKYRRKNGSKKDNI